jgi:hypothetical protein
MAKDPDEFIAAIETFLASNIGVTSIKHPDGRTITLDRKQALAELQYWNTRKQSSSNSYSLNRSRFGLKGDA